MEIRARTDGESVRGGCDFDGDADSASTVEGNGATAAMGVNGGDRCGIQGRKEPRRIGTDRDRAEDFAKSKRCVVCSKCSGTAATCSVVCGKQSRFELLAAPEATPRREQTGLRDYEALRKLWMQKLEENTSDLAILDSATNFLGISDPAAAEGALLKAVKNTDHAAHLLGELYAFAGMGVTAVMPPFSLFWGWRV